MHPTHPASAPSSRLLTWSTRLALALVVCAALALRFLADRWWPATVLMFAPRWLWVGPALVLAPWALWRRSGRRLLELAMAALVWAFGVAGFNLPTEPEAWRSADAPHALRVVSFNMGNTASPTASLEDVLNRLDPDVLALQECHPHLIEDLHAPGRHIVAHHGSCLVTRLKVIRAEQRDQQAIWKLGGSGLNAKYELDLQGQAVTLVNLHLETVRKGLQELIDSRGANTAAMDNNIAQRELESTLARQYAREAAATAPLIVTGDFNMPVESRIYRNDWSDLTNAFERAGWGTGYTKHTRWHGIRIDHVLLGPGWHVSRAWVGPDVGGDHRPMVADLRWTGKAASAAP